MPLIKNINSITKLTKHMNTKTTFVSLLTALTFSACTSEMSEGMTQIADQRASIAEVTFSGSSGNYIFAVTIKSPDTGCDQYADWWEVIKTNGELVYRRILSHSHVGEQPFTRSGGPIAIDANEGIFVRAHMNSNGYAEQVYSGSIAQGLVKDTLDSSFAAELTVMQPFPGECAF